MKKKADTRDEVADSRFLCTVYFLLSSLRSLSHDDPRYSHPQTPHSVQVALDYLPDNYSKALRLKYFEGHSVKHIAQQLEVSVKAAESILTRARLAFREGFGEMAALGRA